MFDLLIPVSLNDSQITEEIQGNRASRRKKKLRPTEALTYSDLVVAMEQRAHTLGQPTQSVANLMSALRAFMEDFSFDADCPIGGSLRSSYYRHIAKHVDIITLAGRKGPYIANRRHLLGKWRSLVLELDRADAAERSAPTPFQNALREILAKCVSRKRVAKDAGISLATLGRWLSGALPNARAIPSIRRLENLFGLHPGALIELTQGKINAPGTTTGEIPAIAYRQRLAKSTSEHFVLKDASPALRNQWLSLVQHKTERLQNLQRQRNGRWSSTKESPKRETDRRWYCFINNEYVATADIYWSHVSSYLGWLMRADNQHKLDCTQETVQTMAWLIAPAGLELYVKWRIKRAGGAAHAGITGFLKFVRSLTHPRTGFFTQTPQFAKSLPQHMQPDDWAIFCQKTFEWVKTTLMALSDRDGNDDEDVENTSRDSFLPIQAVLGLANPMEAVSDMLVRMKSVRPATGGQFEAVWHRDLLLIKILASNSLRAKNMKMMTYTPDDKGNLYQLNGAWRLRFPKRAFKNAKGAAKDRDYDMPIDESAWKDIERYLKRYRPLLPNANLVTYVFLSSSGELPPGPWENLNKRVHILTRQYLMRCPGVGPHSFRHIMATAILKASPNDWTTAALVLHDKVETVRRHYAHLSTNDGGVRMLSLLQSAFQRM